MHIARVEPGWWVDLGHGYLRAVARRGGRPNTQRAYSFELRDLGDWLQRAGVVALSDLNRQHIEAWQDEMATRLAPRTQQVAATAVRGALRWAADQDLALSNPSLWLRVEQRRAPRLVPRPIPLRDLKIIWAYLDAPGATLTELRTRALFWVIFSSGARISEALSLTRTSIQDGTALVIQKGGSPHTLMINRKACASIADYLAARKDRTPALFISHDPVRPLAPWGKQDPQPEWDRLCAELHIGRFTSHQIRHSCATELLRRHVDSLVIAKHMGHRGMGAIAGYAEVALESRREAMEALDRLAG
jgi:site-specific recombinase XerD